MPSVSAGWALTGASFHGGGETPTTMAGGLGGRALGGSAAATELPPARMSALPRRHHGFRVAGLLSHFLQPALGLRQLPADALLFLRLAHVLLKA